jgi:hypothetical protein
LEADKPVTKDLLEDCWIEALDTIAKYQEATKAWRDKSIKTKKFDEGDLVIIRSPQTQARGELEPKWERPYIVTKKTLPYAFRMTSQIGIHLDHNWSTVNLRKFYV